MKKLHTLYLCYFGLNEPLVQTQVVPYLQEITKDGIEVHLLTFEPETPSAEKIAENRQMLAEKGIKWHFLKYHKTPSLPATLYDIACGAIFSWKLNRKEKFDVFHGRVHIPTLMGLFAKKFSFHKPKLLFDVRGFFPEEYTDAGVWKENGFIYKGAKFVEKWLRREADGFVVLTEKAREIWFPESAKNGFDKFGRPVEVIPCCVNLERFKNVDNNLRETMREKLNVQEKRVIVYVGSFGGFYMTQETADFYGAAKRQNPNTFALILTQTKPEMIQPLLENYGYAPEDFFIGKVTPAEIPEYLSAADIAVSFIKPSFSKLASSPTKNAEYLACGLPMIANSNVGDTAEFTREDHAGFIIDEFSEENYLKALTEVEKQTQNREESVEICRQSAEKRFDLVKVGGARYRKLYVKLLGS